MKEKFNLPRTVTEAVSEQPNMTNPITARVSDQRRGEIHSVIVMFTQALQEKSEKSPSLHNRAKKDTLVGFSLIFQPELQPLVTAS